jgi:DNA polymerase-3 subunit epsilon
MEWFDRLPKSVAFVDVETTGLDPSHDRVVTVGGLWLAPASLRDGSLPVSYIHLIFNPGRKSQPRATQVHGYSDWVLEHQEGLSVYYADEVRKFLCSADLIVAHNVVFDVGFINAELTRVQRRPLNRPTFCTLEACRSARGDWDNSLSAICGHLKLARVSYTHSSLQDAWLAMMVYLWLHGCTQLWPFGYLGKEVAPFNYRVPPEPAVGDQPATSTGMSSARTREEFERLAALVERIKEDKRVGLLNEAETLLLAEVEHQEDYARQSGLGVAPWYYEQLAIIYSKQHRYADEIAILERFGQQHHAAGVSTMNLLRRLEKVRLRRC